MPKSLDQTSKPSDTRNALLRAATILFADHGLDAVSVRDITKAAGANLGAITYYFGSKDELIKEVYRVAIAPLREPRLAALDRYESAIKGRHAEPEGVLRALVESTIRTALEPDGEAGYAMRLVFQAYALRRPMLDEVITEQLDQFATRFINALARSMPEVSVEEVGWRYYFTIGATLHVAFDSHRSSRLRGLTGGLCDTSDPDRMIEQLVEFLMGGIRGRGRAVDQISTSAVEKESNTRKTVNPRITDRPMAAAIRDRRSAPGASLTRFKNSNSSS